MSDTQLLSLIRTHAHPITGAQKDFSPLLELIGDAPIVLLGESTHGTHEFYQMRAEITQQLITQKGFNTIALEADWPDTLRVNRFIQGEKTDHDSMKALGGFTRFPQWMWRNTPTVDLIGQLYRHNEKSSDAKKVGIYGLDLYSLYSSIQDVLTYLDALDPAAAQRARMRYNCFEQYQRNVQQYGYAVTFDISASCQQKVIDQLLDLRASALELMRHDGKKAAIEFFYAERNAALIKNAETYYRSLFFSSREESWNIRDTHMMETAQAILEHRGKYHKTPKMIIWAHNSHVGNAQVTELAQHEELNLGQLMKEKYGDAAKLIGFTTYSGTVSAASEWDSPVERKQVRPALKNSYEDLLHAVNIPQFFLPFTNKELAKALSQERLERAIGVIYRPETERSSHYFHAQLYPQFDAIIHLDQTTALEPLEKNPTWISGEFPETYPTGL